MKPVKKGEVDISSFSEEWDSGIQFTPENGITPPTQQALHALQVVLS